MPGMFKRTAQAVSMVAALAVSGCAGWSEVTGGAPPTVDAAALADHPVMAGIDTVGKNVAFAYALIDLYDQRAAKLRDVDYVSSLPLYAAGIATGVLLLHDGSKNAIIDIGLGAAGYYAARSSLDFAGRAEVLDNATAAWQCFADASARVSFLDGTDAKGKAQIGQTIQHDYELLNRTLKKARAYLSNGTVMADPTRQSLIAAIDAGAAVLPAAERIAQAGGQAELTLSKYRRAILRAVASAYAGRRQAFGYKTTVASLTQGVEDLVDYRVRAAQARDKMTTAVADPAEAQATIATTVPAPAPATVTDGTAQGATAAESGGGTSQFAQFVGAVSPTDKDARKLRALVYILMEMTTRFSDNPQYLAVAALPTELAKCVP